MIKRFFAPALITLLTGFIFLSACKKINTATDLGNGLIPVVDNVTTFDTSILVQAFNDTFGLANDSQYLARDQRFWLGKINSDPFFGKTDARIFLELKPVVYKWGFAQPNNVFIDSIFLVLEHVETYGDSTIPQTVNVYEMDPGQVFRPDTSYLVRQNNFTYSSLLGSRTFTPTILNDSINVPGDTTINQMRIKLNNSFGQRLLNYDSAALGEYVNDSSFSANFRGFAIQSMNTGDALMGFNLTGPNTKLAIYYRYPLPGRDTSVVTYFRFTPQSAAASYVKRDYSGTPVEAAVGGLAADPFVYIQSTPGTFATLKIPDLASLPSRIGIVHRAELIMEEVYDPSNDRYPAPAFIYLDAFDPVVSKFRMIPYDLSFDGTGSLNLGGFGVTPISQLDGSGNKIKTWHFNLSRYVQHVLTHTQTTYDLRLYAPFVFVNEYSIPPGPYVTRTVLFNSTIAKGRVRLAGGVPGPQKMRLRIIYSKL